MMCGSVFAYPNNFFEYDFTGNRAIITNNKVYYVDKFTHNSLHPTKPNQTHAFIPFYQYDMVGDAGILTNNINVPSLIEPLMDPPSYTSWAPIGDDPSYGNIHLYCDPASTNEFSHWTLNNQVISTSPAIKINFTGPIIHNYDQYRDILYLNEGDVSSEGTFSITYNYSDGLLDSYTRGYRSLELFTDESESVWLMNTYYETVPLSFSEINIKAHYAISGPVFRVLNVSTNGNGSINIPNDSYPAGTNLNLSVTPNDGWLFTGWSGDISGDYTESNKVITLNEDMNITANFSDDADNDSITNNEEYRIGSNPRYSETMLDMYAIASNRFSLAEAQGTMKDLRVGSQTFGVSNGNATIRMFVDESSDLTSTWSNTQHVLELDIPADEDTKFYRFRMD